tara:strand:+ start:184 stop:576 length:393 start_codon:yes stop_codon:yes gene_type:complete
MKKDELKKLIKPIIKECINEMLLEEGLLKNVVSQVTEGMNVSAPAITEQKTVEPSYEEVKRKTNKVIEAMKGKKIGGTNIFEGTTPAPAQTSAVGQASNPMSHIDPRDPGVDISSLFNPNWKKLAQGKPK